MKSCIITIPIYKQELSFNERVSLERICEVIQDYPVVFFAPENLPIAEYTKFVHAENFSVKYFNSKNFSSIQGYNQLLLSPHFYKLFLDYQYLLIYQLDAFIFKNNIKEWCDKGFDYIGAPWFDNEKIYQFYLKMCSSSNRIARYIKKKIDHNKGEKVHIGNGGLSLRRVKSFYNISKWLHLIEPNIFKYEINEDIIWSVLATKYFKSFKTPTIDEAINFCIEENPKKGLQMLGSELPMGCHAWEKHDIATWRPIFKRFGYNI